MGLLDGNYVAKNWAGVAALVVIAAAAALPAVLLVLEKSVNPKVILQDDSIRILDTSYGRTIPYRTLQIDRATVVTTGQTGIGRLHRVNGVEGLDYCAGWFQLDSGERTFVSSRACRNEAKYLRIPTTDGYSLLIGEPEASRVLAGLKQRLPAQE